MTQNKIDGARQIKDYSIPAVKFAGGALTEFARVENGWTSTSLVQNASDSGTIQLATGFRLIHVETNIPARVRLYTTEAKRAADVARLVEDPATGDHGLILEYVTTADCLAADLSPTVDAYCMADPLSSDIPIGVTNLDPDTDTVIVTLSYIITEA